MGNRIVRKTGSTSGASMVLALGIMLAVSLLCVSMLKIAATAPQASYAQQDQEPRADFSPDCPVNGDAGPADPCDDRPHGTAPL